MIHSLESKVITILCISVSHFWLCMLLYNYYILSKINTNPITMTPVKKKQNHKLVTLNWLCYVFLRFRTSLYNLVMGLLLVGSSTFDARFLPFNIIGIDQNLFWELKMIMLTNLLGQFVYMYTMVIFQFDQLFRIDIEMKD